MAYAINVYFDAQTENLIRGVWQKLADMGVSNNMIEKGGRPHVALLVFEDCDPGEVSAKLRQFADHQQPVEFRFETLGTFCSKDGVLFLEPSFSPWVFLLYNDVRKLTKNDYIGLKDGCKPQRYVPHCTVAYGLDKDTLSKTVSMFSNKALPIIGRFDRIGLVELPRMDDKCLFHFMKPFDIPGLIA